MGYNSAACSAVKFGFMFIGITGFWGAPPACVNYNAFRQDLRDGQDMLCVGFGLYYSASII